VIQKVIVQLAISRDLPAVVQGFADQIGLPGIFPSPLAQRAFLRGITTAGLHSEAAAHCPHVKTIALLGNERVSNFASRAKYSGAFFRMSHSAATRASSRFI
jgi:hypothetical protein